MEAFLSDHILRYGPQANFGTSAKGVQKANAIILAAQRVGTSCLEFLNDTYVKERQQAVRSHLENILNVIDTSTAFFDEDAEDDMALRFFKLKSSKYSYRSYLRKLTNISLVVIPALTKITVEELDEEISGML
jgi:ubiquitin carboxyl-terminal hydrolase 34